MNAIATVKSEGLNVRSRAYQDAPIVHVLTKGDKVPVLERRRFDGGYVWLKVGLKGKPASGWVDASFVTVKSTLPDVEPPHIPVPDDINGIVLWAIGGGLAAAIIVLWAVFS